MAEADGAVIGTGVAQRPRAGRLDRDDLRGAGLATSGGRDGDHPGDDRDGRGRRLPDARPRRDRGSNTRPAPSNWWLSGLRRHVLRVRQVREARLGSPPQPAGGLAELRKPATRWLNARCPSHGDEDADSSPRQQGLHGRDRCGTGRLSEPDPFALLEAESARAWARVVTTRTSWLSSGAGDEADLEADTGEPQDDKYDE